MRKKVLSVIILLVSLCTSAQDSTAIVANAAIQKSIVYFQQHKEFLSAFNIIGLTHIQNQYGTDFSFDLNELLRHYKPNGKEEEEQLPYFKRLMVPPMPVKNPRKEEINKLDPISKLMVWAIYADKIPVTNEFWDSVSKFAADTTENKCRMDCHMSFAMKWLTDLGAIKKPEKAEKIKESIIRNMPAKIEAVRPFTDDGLEGVLALMLNDRYDLVKKEWILQIAKNIRDDGGWSWDPADRHNQFSNDHTSALGLWVLTAYLHPEGTKKLWVK
jgi:hypothetical protein